MSGPGRRWIPCRLRCGAVLSGPKSAHLDYLFHEIWLKHVYTPTGYSIGPDDVIIDIGANIEVFTLYAAIQARRGRVIAYEPCADSFHYLEKNLQDSGLKNVEAVCAAVAGTSGSRFFNITPGNLITNAIARSDSSRQSPTVRCLSLDDVFQKHAIERCALLKIDCEGSEYEILEKASPETFSRITRIVGEYHEGGDIIGTSETLCRLLQERSFKIERNEPAG